MNILLLGSFPTAAPLYYSMIASDDTVFVAVQTSLKHKIAFGSLEDLLHQNNTPFLQVSKKNICSEFPDWLQKNSIDLVIVFGFSYKISKEIITIPKLGFINIHFGKLPQNRGADPVFWSLQKQHKETAISVHHINEALDEGALVFEHKVPIVDGETYGMLNSKMCLLTAQLYELFMPKVFAPELYRDQSTKGVNYYKKPIERDCTIDWEKQSANEIKYLINACNPKYGGAITYYQGSMIKIIESNVIKWKTKFYNKKLGEIIHAHPHEGLYVYCKKGDVLRIKCISSDAGILSGTKYVQLGISKGHFFDTKPNNKIKNFKKPIKIQQTF